MKKGYKAKDSMKEMAPLSAMRAKKTMKHDDAKQDMKMIKSKVKKSCMK
jgi:hypothetical protein